MITFLHINIFNPNSFFRDTYILFKYCNANHRFFTKQKPIYQYFEKSFLITYKDEVAVARNDSLMRWCKYCKKEMPIKYIYDPNATNFHSLSEPILYWRTSFVKIKKLDYLFQTEESRDKYVFGHTH